MRKRCLNTIYELAKQDPRVVFIGSDLGPGTLDQFREEMPERFFMEGVSEQHIIGMAAGLCMDGYIPFVNTIATFLTRRCYEQIAIDLCMHNLPVRLIGNGGGLVYAPLGPTHLATDDFALLGSLPNMSVVAPCDADEIERLTSQTLDYPGPLYMRLGKGGDPVVSSSLDNTVIGKANTLKEPGDVLFVSTGVMVNRCLIASELLAEYGIKAGVLNMHTIKPLDKPALLRLAAKVRSVVTVEEHITRNGLGSAVTEAIVESALTTLPSILKLGLPDSFADQYGSQDLLLESYGLQPASIAESVKRLVAKQAA